MEKIFSNIIPSKGEVAILLYGEVGEGCRVDSLRVVQELGELARRYRKIDIRINSCGGDVFSGIAIYNALRTSDADITIYVDGVAASIAGVIALCGKPLYLSPYARLMLHNVRGSASGTASDLRSVAQTIDSLEETLAEMVSARLKMPAHEVREAYLSGGDHWFTAQQAVAMGLADGFSGGEAPSMTEDTPVEEIYQYVNALVMDTDLKKEHMNGLLEEIREIPSFAGVEDEQAVVARLRDMSDELCRMKAEQEAALARELETAHQMISEALEGGRISADQASSLKALLVHDREQTLRLLGSLTAKAPVARASQVYAGGSGPSLSAMSWDELDRNGRLEALRQTDIESFKEKYKARFGVEYK